MVSKVHAAIGPLDRRSRTRRRHRTPLLILLNVSAILKEQLQGTSDLNTGNPTFQNSKPKLSSRFATTKISSLPTPTKT
jgi:hypothetical protein